MVYLSSSGPEESFDVVFRGYGKAVNGGFELGIEDTACLSLNKIVFCIKSVDFLVSNVFPSFIEMISTQVDNILLFQCRMQ